MTAPRSPLVSHGDAARHRVEDHRAGTVALGERHAGGDRGVPAERDLGLGAEVADVVVAVVARRDERGLGVAEVGGDLQHLLGAHAGRVEHDAGRVAAVGRVGERRVAQDHAPRRYLKAKCSPLSPSSARVAPDSMSARRICGSAPQSPAATASRVASRKSMPQGSSIFGTTGRRRRARGPRPWRPRRRPRARRRGLAHPRRRRVPRGRAMRTGRRRRPRSARPCRRRARPARRPPSPRRCARRRRAHGTSSRRHARTPARRGWRPACPPSRWASSSRRLRTAAPVPPDRRRRRRTVGPRAGTRRGRRATSDRSHRPRR